ncbi:nuclear transport factor 2 family protein [Spirosoma sp. BT702]|uniref:Nuclear transport factor 2 family protein n=1 Tax=Spirosoma profusum TaxID=2771354 RepID=A0A927AQG3_9BACT|nr:nuclear transport factor 2 family protein [Spirosoma profusum]MBD2700408.1 nuclear transport factor 2 family protein [Spirosoma profusum]
MKTVALTLIAIYSMLTTTSFAQKDSKDQSDVEQAVEQFRMLLVDPDKAKLEAITAKELSYGHSNGKLETQNELIEAYVTGVYDFKSITNADQTVTVVGNTAIVRNKLMGESQDKGKDPAQVKLSVLTVWVKQQGGWKLLARQAVKI